MHRKINNLKDLSEDYLRKEVFDLLWPYEKLKLDLKQLEQVDLPAAKIAVFLFKAQLVEVELRSLLDSIESFLELKTRNFHIYRKVTKKIVEKRKNSSLGQLKDELNLFKGSDLEKLKSRLSLFDKKRNEFTHHLFLQGRDVKDLANEAEKYKKYAEESLELIQKIRKDIWNKYET